MKKNSQDRAKLLIDKNSCVLIDVRDRDEFYSEHIPKAINIPLFEINESIAKFARPSDTIVVYCGSGALTGTAKMLLNSMGYNNIIDIGGIIDWKYRTVKNTYN